MKKLSTYLGLGVLLIITSCTTTKNFAQNYSDDPSEITYQQFYDDLSPYGNWVSYENYGYVWVPDAQGFRPYYNDGHWVYTDLGWTWVSDYSWGWAPFHYGRWLNDNAYGWMWVPGYEWAPAWVSWRSNGDYYGWAPLGPGININMNFGSQIPYDYWAFVPNRYINSPRLNNYYINRERNVTIINNTTIVNNTTVTRNHNRYFAGPSANDVERNTHERIMPARVVQRNNPGESAVNGSTVSMYRPSVRQRREAQEKPSRIDNLNEMRARHENGGSRNVLNPTDRILPAPDAQGDIQNRGESQGSGRIIRDHGQQITPSNERASQGRSIEQPAQVDPYPTQIQQQQQQRANRRNVQRNDQPVRNLPDNQQTPATNYPQGKLRNMSRTHDPISSQEQQDGQRQLQQQQIQQQRQAQQQQQQDQQRQLQQQQIQQQRQAQQQQQDQQRQAEQQQIQQQRQAQRQQQQDQQRQAQQQQIQQQRQAQQQERQIQQQQNPVQKTDNNQQPIRTIRNDRSQDNR